jgi:hypothetical protein
VRIGFLFNHDQVHQVAHGLPVALALAAMGTGAEILVCASNDRVAEEIRKLAGDAVGRDFALVRLRLKRWSSRLIDAVAGRVIPSAKLLIYRDNLEFFRSLDVLVVPEKTSLVLKDRYRLDRLKIIHTRHGAGDRAIGFSKESARFDHILASGTKVRDRLVREAGVPPDRISVVGYPKFDLFKAASSAPRADDRPTVVYNPHVAPHLSSWYREGRKILRWFAAHPEYKLIFAPHIMLFQRPVVVTVQPPRIARSGRVPDDVRGRENIVIDTDSRALTTMEYLNQANIYLGDASSQIYEFLREPRPSVFFNAHGFDWKNNPDFAHWTAGAVINDVDELGPALATAAADHEHHYRQAQTDLMRYTFDVSDEPSSVRAAEAIAEVAGLRPRRKKRKTAAAARADALPRRSPSIPAASSS